MRQYLLLLSCIWCTLTSAAERSDAEMMEIARSKLQVTARTRGVLKGNAPILLRETRHYNIYGSDNRGFVIISRDKSQTPVIGYSHNRFPKNLPPSMEWFLEMASNEVCNNAHFIKEQESLPKEVSSFVKTKWGQGEPYNMFTPTYKQSGQKLHYPTGCVATAMAQVMRHYNSPAAGTGGSAYYVDGKTLPVIVDFSKTIYDWGNMLYNYSSDYTNSQAEAVATLMYHCGAAVEMTYDTSGSGALMYMGCKAMRNKFGYGEAHYYLRSFIDEKEWLTLIFETLSRNEPIIYGGQDSKYGGHAFVLDGYDEDGLVSVNWGWNGDADGFYDITLLNPRRQSFQYGQDMVISGKPESEVCLSSSWGLGDTLKIVRLTNDSILVNCEGFFNLDPNPFEGELGLIAEQEGVKFEIFADLTDNRVDFGKGYALNDADIYVGDLPEGEYQVYMACRAKGEDDWHRMRSHEEVPGICILKKMADDIELPNNSSYEMSIRTMRQNKAFIDHRIFDIRGRSLGTSTDALPKGIYIIGGKKVVK